MLQVHEYRGADDYPLRYGKLTNSGQADNGRALLFVPGLGGSVKNALDFLQALLPEFGTIYGPDLRGFGLNPLTTPLHHVKTIQADLEAFHQQVLVPAGHREVVLCGISLGAVLAILMSNAHPERYSRLIILAPAFRPHPKSFGLKYTLINTLAFLIKGKNARTILPYGIKELTRNKLILDDPQYTEAAPLLLNPGFLLSVRDLSNRAMSSMPNLHLPTFMVIPGQDVVCDPLAMRQAYGRIPATTPKRCLDDPEFYHDVLFEAECERIAQETLDWLSVPSDSAAISPSSR